MTTIKFLPFDVLPNADIHPQGIVSRAFLELKIATFRHAAEYVHQLPYGENSHSEDSMILLNEGLGTCVTKHGLIARLAEELGLLVFRCEGFYELNDEIVTGVNAILKEYGLPYIPRTHCFLSCDRGYVDLTEGNCTGKNQLIEKYLDIYRVNPEQTQSERDEMYRQYYTKVCEADAKFAKIGVGGMLEILKRCQVLSAGVCQRKPSSSTKTDF
jgi:hypothetical protein